MINFENLDKFMFHGVGKYDIFHGGVPEDCQNFGGNIIRIEPYYERIAKRRKEKAAIAKDPADQR